MNKHFEILVDASGSMGFMKDSEDENKYLLPDGKSTRTDLVKKIMIESVITNLSFVDTINISTFRNSYSYNAKGFKKKAYRWVQNSKGEKIRQTYHPMPHKLDSVFRDKYNKEAVIKAIKTITNPEIGGTPLRWALAYTINNMDNNTDIIVLSDGDANDEKEFDAKVLDLLKTLKKDCTIHFIGIAQDNIAQKKSKNLAEKTGGIYTNIKALNYDKDALNVILSKLNTSIIANALEESINETKTIAETKIVENKDEKIDNETHVTETTKSSLEKQVHKNTASLEFISGQLNNILTLLQSKNQLEEDVTVVENKTYNKRIGHLAEDYLFKKLQELFKGRTTKITWLNENGERGLPYDFLVERDKKKFYYECKGTSSDLLEFQLTKNEWDFYLENKGHYRLCFVKNVDAVTQYVRFMNLLEDMEQHKLVPCSSQNKAYKANRLVFSIYDTKVEWK